jgi:phosphate transport system substrate-binding protein
MPVRNRACPPCLIVTAIAALGVTTGGCRSRPPGDGAGPAAQAAPSAPPSPPPVRLTVKSAASDGAVSLMKAWAEEQARLTPSLAVEVSGGGLDAGIAALVQGTANLALTTRKLRQSELDLLRQRAGGREPKEFVAGFQAICVYVNRANPTRAITVHELGQLYARQGRLDKWSNLGLGRIPRLADQKAVRVRLNDGSGTTSYFREAVLGPADDRAGTLEVGTLDDLVTLIASTPGAIGYGTCGTSAEAKVLEISTQPGKPGVLPTRASIADGSYPLARPIRLQVPGNAAEHVNRYLDWVLSESGQRVVDRMGYVRLAAAP